MKLNRQLLSFFPIKIDDQEAIVILEKTPIGQDTLVELLKDSSLQLKMKNDIYSNYLLIPPAHLNGMYETSDPPPSSGALSLAPGAPSVLLHIIH